MYTHVAWCIYLIYMWIFDAQYLYICCIICVYLMYNIRVNLMYNMYISDVYSPKYIICSSLIHYIFMYSLWYITAEMKSHLNYWHIGSTTPPCFTQRYIIYNKRVSFFQQVININSLLELYREKLIYVIIMLYNVLKLT